MRKNQSLIFPVTHKMITSVLYCKEIDARAKRASKDLRCIFRLGAARARLGEAFLSDYTNIYKAHMKSRVHTTHREIKYFGSS